MLLDARPPLKGLWRHLENLLLLANKFLGCWGKFIACTSLASSPAVVGMVTFVCVRGRAPGRSAAALPVCGTCLPGTEPAGLCTAGSHRCLGSLVENKQVLCQCCQENMQLLSAPITRRR